MNFQITAPSALASYVGLGIKGAIRPVVALIKARILFIGVVNMRIPDYGTTLLQMISSVYPGFHASRTLGHVAYGSILAFFDGAIAGLLMAWLYNIFSPNVQD